MTPKGDWVERLGHDRIGLRAKNTTPLEPSSCEKFSATFRGHSLPKSHFVFALSIMRLKCTFHEVLLSKNLPEKTNE